MKEIDIALIKELISYDSVTGEFRRKTSGGGVTGGALAGTIGNCGYRIISLKKNRFVAHRLAWVLTYGRWPQDQIDHINGDRSDNRLINLREATQSQNNANSKLREDNPCQAKGVSFFKQTQKYRAYVTVDGKQHHLGYFPTLEEAIQARIQSFTAIYGEFARP